MDDRLDAVLTQAGFDEAGIPDIPDDEREATDRCRVAGDQGIEDDDVVYSGATIRGGDTVIGGNVWLTRSVPPYTRVIISEPELLIGSK